MSWEFTREDNLRIRGWSTKDTREGEKSQFFFPLMFGYEGENKRVPYMPEASKFKGIVRTVTEFKSNSGDQVTIPHVPRLKGRGTHGNQMLRGNALNHTLGDQSIFIDYIATQVVSKGPLNDRRVGLNFIETMRPAMRDWYSRKVEEGIILALSGLTTWNNTSVLDNWTPGAEDEVFNNVIEAFDADHILYAGDATSDGTIDSADVLTASFLDRIQTHAKEDLDDPIEFMKIDGEECALLLTSGRGIEQLKADETFREAHTRVIKDARNPLTMRASYKYGNLYIAEYPKLLRPVANVQRSLLLGAEALLFAKIENMKYFLNDADDADRRKALSITGAVGAKANAVASVRRNALAIDHWVRS